MGPGWFPGPGPQSRAGTFSACRALAVSPIARAKLLAGLGTNSISASSVPYCPAPSPDLNLPLGPRCAPRPSRVRGRTAGKCNFLRPPRFRASTPFGPVRGDRLLPRKSLCRSAKFSRREGRLANFAELSPADYQPPAGRCARSSSGAWALGSLPRRSGPLGPRRGSRRGVSCAGHSCVCRGFCRPSRWVTLPSGWSSLR